MTTSIGEVKTMTESEKLYRMWERIEEMNLTNPIEPKYQWRNVMQAKWHLLTNTGGN